MKKIETLCGHPGPCGCYLHDCCEVCPEEICVFELPRKSIKAAANRQEARDLANTGLTARQISDQLGISERTINRYLKTESVV